MKYYFRKSKKFRHVTISTEGLENIGEVLEEDNRENLFETLARVLQNLEDEALQLIELRFFEQKSFKEIGFILDITENNAKVRTYRLLEKLRLAMSHEQI